MELGPLSIKKWDAGEKNGEIGQFLAELVFWLSCKITFFTISNHTNGAADFIPNTIFCARHGCLQRGGKSAHDCKTFSVLPLSMKTFDLPIFLLLEVDSTERKRSERRSFLPIFVRKKTHELLRLVKSLGIANITALFLG